MIVPYVEIQAITPPTLASSSAFDNQNNAPIYVPDESVDDYKTATNWVSLANRIFSIKNKSTGQKWKLLRDRTPGANLNSVATGTTIGSLNLGTTINMGDVLAIELSFNNGSYTYPNQVVTITMNYNTTSPSNAIEHYYTTISRLYGSRLRNYTFTCSYSNTNIYFGNKSYLEGYFSGSEIQWTTNSYTLYVGKVWRLEG